MPKQEINLYIEDIYFSCNKIANYTKDYNFEKFRKDEKTVDAVVRNLEIIGEAAKNIPPKLRKQYKEIPWTKIISMRNKITHEYFGIDHSILWKTVEEDIPTLKKKISKIKQTFIKRPLF